ncbi:MAG: flagellar M-ring protein FliF C-terminal domain-containing protein [Candidatus Xenobia bacterium]
MPTELKRAVTAAQTPQTQVRLWWKSLSTRARACVVVGAVVLVLSLCGTRVALDANAWVPLYPFAISGANEHRITTILTMNGCPFSDEHGTIRVPPRIKARVVTMLWEQEKLPHDPEPALKSTGPFPTEIDEQQLQLQATERSLTEAIRTFSFVRDCRVRIVPVSEDDAVLHGDRPTTASVELELRPQARPTAAQVASIVDLVSHWYSGLKPENVSVVTTDGEDLTKLQHEDEATFEQLRVKSAYERLFLQSLQPVLDKELGAAGYTLVVDCAIDPEALKVTTKQILDTHPTKTIRKETDYHGQKAASSEVAGPPSGATVYHEIQERIQSEASFSQMERVRAAGALKRISASLAINRAITPKQRAEWETWLKSAIGCDESRGDEVCVREGTFVPVLTPPLPPEVHPVESPSWPWPLLAGVAVALGFAIFLVTWRPALQPRVQPRAPLTEEHDIADLRATQADLRGRLHTLAQTQPDMLAARLRQMV